MMILYLLHQHPRPIQLNIWQLPNAHFLMPSAMELNESRLHLLI